MADQKNNDWEKEIDPKYILDKDNKKYVLLHGLRLIAKKRGYKSKIAEMIQCPTPQNGLRAITKVRYEWTDGQIDEAIADACPDNIGGKPFNQFPTIISYNRAEAVLIRTALGINMNALEELGGNSEGQGSTPASPQQKEAIQKLINRKNANYGEVLSAVGIKAGEDLTSIDFNKVLDNATEEQASQMMAFLNKGK